MKNRCSKKALKNSAASMRIAFFGTPDFAASILQDLLATQWNLVGIVTRPDRPKDRSLRPQPSAVKVVAQRICPDVPLLQPEKASAPETVRALAALRPDLFVVVAYGHILRKSVLDLPPLGCVNVHASLLPKYRGAAPIQRCLMDGEGETGVTIMRMDEGMDTGPMLRIASLPIPPDMTYGELRAQLCELAKEPLRQTLQDLENGVAVATPQEEALASYAPKVEPEEGRIDWSGPASAVYNRMRGVTPEPGAWCVVAVRGQQKRLRLLKARLAAASGLPGQLVPAAKGQMIVACSQGAIELLEVQLEGKRSLRADEFLRGYPPHAISLCN